MFFLMLVPWDHSKTDSVTFALLCIVLNLFILCSIKYADVIMKRVSDRGDDASHDLIGKTKCEGMFFSGNNNFSLH
jgi:hypothetical protein